MKVYVVSQGDYSDNQIVAVYDNEEMATKLQESISSGTSEGVYVEEFELNSVRPLATSRWIVAYDTDHGPRSANEYRFLWGPWAPPVVSEISRDSISSVKWRVEVSADNKEQALRIADDVLAKHRAGKAGL